MLVVAITPGELGIYNSGMLLIPNEGNNKDFMRP